MSRPESVYTPTEDGLALEEKWYYGLDANIKGWRYGLRNKVTKLEKN